MSLALVVLLMHNSLVGKKNAVENAFGSIDAMCKKRYDLIPNLVASVKSYMEHESGTLERMVELRNQARSGTPTPDETVRLNNEITSALGRLIVAVEDYPDLKASDNFMQLQRALNEAEEQLSASRRAFNAAVTDYNNAVGMTRPASWSLSWAVSAASSLRPPRQSVRTWTSVDCSVPEWAGAWPTHPLSSSSSKPNLFPSLSRWRSAGRGWRSRS